MTATAVRRSRYLLAPEAWAACAAASWRRDTVPNYALDLIEFCDDCCERVCQLENLNLQDAQSALRFEPREFRHVCQCGRSGFQSATDDGLDVLGLLVRCHSDSPSVGRASEGSAAAVPTPLVTAAVPETGAS